MIDPAFWNDSKIIELSIPARLLYIGLWNYADDEGFFLDDLPAIKRTLFPDQNFDIHGVFSECSRFLKRYQFKAPGSHAWEILQFKEWQTINRPTPSKIKPFCTLTEDSLNPHGALTPKLNKEKLREVNTELLRSSSSESQKIRLSDSKPWPPEDAWLKKRIEDHPIFSEAREYLAVYEWWEDVAVSINGIDQEFIDPQFAKMSAWIRENPKRRPTLKGMRRFIRTWLEREKERERRRVYVVKR